MILVMERLNETWNCGDNFFVENISTKATVLVWIGDIPKYTPVVILSFQLSKGSSTDKGRANEYTG